MLNAYPFFTKNKPYFVAATAAACAVAAALGHPVPDWVYTLLGAAGLGAVHHSINAAIDNVSASSDDDEDDSN